MKRTNIQQAAKRLSDELGINPAHGCVWVRRIKGNDSILVEVAASFRGTIPTIYDGFPVTKRNRLNPEVRGIQNDFSYQCK
jgi:hypothetical protein